MPTPTDPIGRIQRPPEELDPRERELDDFRKRAEDAQARLAAIVESSQDAIISKTLDSRIVSWNAAASQLFGYSADEAIGRSITMLIPADRQDEERVILERLRRGERIEHYETVRMGKDGRLIEVSLTISPIRDGDGRIVGASKICRDVTERRRAERRQAAQHRVTRILAESPSGAEAAPRILETICEELGWDVGAFWSVEGSPRELRCVEVYQSPSVPRFESASRGRTFAPGEGLPGRVWARGQTTCIPDVAHDASFVRSAAADADGLHGALGFPILLSDSVLGVIELFSREVRSPDEDLIVTMTAIGSQIGQFVERKRAEEALRDADQRKDEFLAMLAHELRNPLAPMRNAVEILRTRTRSEPELRWATDVVDRQLHQLTRLVDDLLDVSRITRGNIELRKQVVDLAAVLESAVETTNAPYEKRRHELVVSLPPEPIHVEGDPTRLSQVLSNLLSNAAKYTDAGGRVVVTAVAHDGEARITVEDNGIGITPEMLPRVFDLFAQEDRALARSEGGLGIGLTLVRRLVELHGGSVEVRSGGLGKGSAFVVRLPIAAKPPAAAAGDGAIVASAAARTCRILVVDDNRDAAESLRVLLDTLGNEVRTAYDGLAAVEAAAEFRPDVVLLDIGLPQLSGYEVARRIRRDSGDRATVLVAFTGWGQEEDLRQSREAGFDHHITKPVDFDVLRKLLERASPTR